MARGRWGPCKSPSGPSTTWRTTSESISESTTRSAWAATSAGVTAALPPQSSSCRILAGSRSQPATPNPLSRRRWARVEPTRPMVSAVLGASFIEIEVGQIRPEIVHSRHVVTPQAHADGMAVDAAREHQLLGLERQ